MNQRCAWCNTVYGTKKSSSGQRTSHGVCAACKERFLEKLRTGDRTHGTVAPQPTSLTDGKPNIR